MMTHPLFHSYSIFLIINLFTTMLQMRRQLCFHPDPMKRQLLQFLYQVRFYFKVNKELEFIVLNQLAMNCDVTYTYWQWLMSSLKLKLLKTRKCLNINSFFLLLPSKHYMKIIIECPSIFTTTILPQVYFPSRIEYCTY